MNTVRSNKIRLVIVGATGMVGGYVLRYALEQPVVEGVTAIVRRNLGISPTKIREVQHRNFADGSALAEVLSGRDARSSSCVLSAAAAPMQRSRS